MARQVRALQRDHGAHGSPGFAADRSGTVLVEFAFIAPVLLLMLLGMIEIGRFHLTRSTLETAVAAAMRTATIDPAASDATLLQVLRDNLAGLDPARVEGLTVIREAEPASSLVWITLRAAITFEPIVTLVMPAAVQIEATARGVAIG
jgi:hypothetical protein